MKITEAEQFVVDHIYEYFNELGFHNIIIYGSYIERMHGFDVVPNDIDVTIVIDEAPPEPRHKSFYLGFTGLTINVEFLQRSSFEAELNSMQPKYFMCIGNPAIMKDIDDAFYNKELHEVRSCISSITSKAFDKGKKKLQIEADYDKVLGLKNLYHAFKFPLYAKWFYLKEQYDVTDKEVDILTLNEIHNLIITNYDETTGTIEERCTQLIEMFKPLHNSLMTQFRIDFPKKVEK